MNAIKSQSGMLIALAATAVFAFLLGDALGDPLIGALAGAIAFVVVMPVVALARSSDNFRTD